MRCDASPVNRIAKQIVTLALRNGRAFRMIHTHQDGQVEAIAASAIVCPHCQTAFTEAEMRSILGQFARSKRLSSLGASRFAKMTAEEKSAEGRRAAMARWSKSERMSENVRVG